MTHVVVNLKHLTEPGALYAALKGATSATILNTSVTEPSDAVHASRVKDAVASLNHVGAEAIAHGLSVEYDTRRFEQLGMPDGEFVEVKVRRSL